MVIIMEKKVEEINKRLDKIDNILDITDGYKPVKTIKNLTKGVAEGTANFMQEMSIWKLEMSNRIKKILILMEKILNYVKQ